FRDGLTQLRDMFTFRRLPWSYVRLLHEDEEPLVRESIRWMYIELGRDVGGPKLRADYAVKQAEGRIGVLETAYEELAVAWWKAEPWTVIRASNGQKPVGMCIGLPVHTETYKRVRQGRQETYACSQLCNPSADVVVEGLAMRPYEDGATLRKQT